MYYIEMITESVTLYISCPSKSNECDNKYEVILYPFGQIFIDLFMYNAVILPY